MDIFYKQPAEVIDYAFDFSQALNTNDSIVTPTPSIVVQTGTGTAPTIGTTTPYAATGIVKQRISGGVDGQVCLLTMRVGTLSGEILESEVHLKIKEIQ